MYSCTGVELGASSSIKMESESVREQTLYKNTWAKKVYHACDSNCVVLTGTQFLEMSKDI